MKGMKAGITRHASQSFENPPAISGIRAVRRLRAVYWALLAAGVSLFTAPAMAFVTPTEGSFGYDMYDIFINKMIGGAPGWVGAGFLLVFGLSQIMKQWMIGIACIVASGLVIKITTILSSLGAVIS